MYTIETIEQRDFGAGLVPQIVGAAYTSGQVYCQTSAAAMAAGLTGWYGALQPDCITGQNVSFVCLHCYQISC